MNIDTLPENLCLKDTLSRMRNQRDGFVQRLSQYVFCYKTIERYFVLLKNNNNNENNSENSGVTSSRKKKKKN